MSWRTQVGFIGLVLALVLGLPARVEAQSGVWEYIFRLSGPEYRKAVSGRVSACITRPWCLEAAVGPLAFDREEDRAIEPQVGFALTYGWDGDNDEKRIADTNMLVLEPQARFLVHEIPVYLPSVFSSGLGFHRFSGGTVPEEFWRTAFVWSVAWRFDQELVTGERLDPGDQLGWFVEGGVKFRSFFDRLLARDFGGLPNDDETEATGWGLFIGGGLRWDLR